MRLVRVLAAGAAAAAATAVWTGAAGAYDRTPVTVTGLKPDHWGFTALGAENDLKGRYDGVSWVRCVGVIIAGNESHSSWVHGWTRYWDKLSCEGTSTQGNWFSLLYDARGGSADAWTIYRLQGISLAELKGEY